MGTTLTSRRAFLKHFAQQAGYAIPLIHTLAAPEALSGQPATSGKMSGMSMGMGMLVAPSSPAEYPAVLGPEAPWSGAPPGYGG